MLFRPRRNDGDNLEVNLEQLIQAQGSGSGARRQKQALRHNKTRALSLMSRKHFRACHASFIRKSDFADKLSDMQLSRES